MKESKTVPEKNIIDKKSERMATLEKEKRAQTTIENLTKSAAF